jgi:hypothetical protein
MITDESITQIANQLGMATEHIYEVFVAAQPTIAIMQLACCIIIIGCAALGFYAHKKYELGDDIPSVMVAFISGLVGVFISLVVYDSARCYFLPEYSAIMKLMELTIGGI